MTKKLEDLLGINHIPEDQEDEEESTDLNPDDVLSLLENKKKLNELDIINAALPSVSGLGASSDLEFDEIANKAQTAFNDLMDLGLSVEAKYASKLFDAASAMLTTALNAKVAKIDKKLKTVDLQLKKVAIENKASRSNRQGGTVQDVTDVQEVYTDRNGILKSLQEEEQDRQ